MAAPKYWSIQKYDSGAGVWLRETQIPRAGLDNFTRTKDSMITFVQLADGSEAKNSTETKSLWRDIDLVFPKQVVTNAFKTQMLTYIDNEWGIKIPIPILTGASAYTETVLKGYMTKFQEEWLPGDEEQDYQVRITLHEFSVDGT
jgi:hypothetical protein